MKQITLKHKILFGYIILTAVIVGMVAVLFNERQRVRSLESGANDIAQIRKSINTAHRQITILATYGESVIAWNEEDYLAYHNRRVNTDTLLQQMKQTCSGLVLPEQIDTLRFLLSDKEEHPYGIMQVVKFQKSADSLLLNHRYAATSAPQTITRKKKGMAGFFGKKETVQVPQSNTSIYALNRKLIKMYEERAEAMAARMDSLRSRNLELNRKLYTLVSCLDSQAENALNEKRSYLEESYIISTRIVFGLFAFAAILLILSYLVIQRDMKREAIQKAKTEKVIEKNDELLETRKNIILAISHDIRAPLNIINGSAELAMETRDKRHRNVHLANIGIVCRHILHLLNNLLDVYRLNESKETCNNVSFDLKALLERISSGFSRIINDKGIQFHTDFRNTDVILYGDADRIEQILDNLLSNSVKFTEAGTITLRADYADGRLSLQVTDSGIGMSKETMSRIFRPFEKLASQTNSDGFGLGLPITKGIVHLMGGTIEVESEQGYGSTFIVSIPLSVSDEEIKHADLAAPTSGTLPRYVLVIDDDTLQLKIVNEMLERNGVMCTVCSNVKDLVKEMRKKDYDLLLTDIQMPNTDGFGVLTLLRNANIGNSRLIPIVAMTARGDQEKESFVKSGFSDCIYKPFSTSELLCLLAAFANNREEDDIMFPDFRTFTTDVEDKVGLLRMFVRQSRKDMDDLRSAMEIKDIRKLRDVVHRIQAPLEMLQSDELLYDYIKILKNGTSSMKIIEEYTARIIEHLSVLVKETENEIRRISHET